MKTCWKLGENLVKTSWKLGENLVKTWWKHGEHIVKTWWTHCETWALLSIQQHTKPVPALDFFFPLGPRARLFVLQNKLEKRARARTQRKKVFTFSWEVIHWIRQAWWKPGENLMEFRKLVFYATNMVEQNLVNFGNSVKSWWDSDTTTNLVKTREKPRWKLKEL